MCSYPKNVTLMALLMLFSVPSLAQLSRVEKMLTHADAFRLDLASAHVVSLVTLYQNGEQDKTRRYDVYTRPERQSLVIFKSQVEAGQKMLMLGDNYWLLMPKSRRPIRITPMQKLLGEASIGDISTLKWSDDYHGQWQAEEILALDGEQITANRLELSAATDGASYQRITLWLTASDDFPLKADLYLRSGKLAKQARFHAGDDDGKRRVVAMTLFDRIQPAKKTVIEYQSIVPVNLDDKYYNPAYLARSDAVEW